MWDVRKIKNESTILNRWKDGTAINKMGKTASKICDGEEMGIVRSSILGKYAEDVY